MIRLGGLQAVARLVRCDGAVSAPFLSLVADGKGVLLGPSEGPEAVAEAPP